MFQLKLSVGFLVLLVGAVRCQNQNVMRMPYSQANPGGGYPSKPQRELLKGQQIVSMDDYQIVARNTLRREVYDFIAYGAWNELTLIRSRQALDNVTLYPRYLRDVSQMDTTKEVLGRAIDYPIGIPPFECTGAIIPEGDLALARGKSRT